VITRQQLVARGAHLDIETKTCRRRVPADHGPASEERWGWTSQRQSQICARRRPRHSRHHVAPAPRPPEPPAPEPRRRRERNHSHNKVPVW